MFIIIHYNIKYIRAKTAILHMVQTTSLQGIIFLQIWINMPHHIAHHYRRRCYGRPDLIIIQINELTLIKDNKIDKIFMYYVMVV